MLTTHCMSLLLFACGGAASTNQGTTPDDPEADITATPNSPLRGPSTPPQAAPGVTRTAVVCDEAASESCNALDEDCDGIIDEGCGYETGPLQVTVAWNSGADLDLYLTDPSGETTSNQEPEAPSGAHVDHNGRGDCGPAGPNPRIENLRFAERPPAGDYALELHYLMECETHTGPTTATISVSVAEELVGSYNYTLAPNERIQVLRFRLP